MKRVCMLVIWMGILPESYPLWEMSAKENKSIDFFVISDHVEDGKSDNITFIHEEMEQLRQRFQRLFPFAIKLNTPYKICDYKPIYGSAFPDIIKDYDFWGHCDLDIIFGDIRHFITDELLEKYDKIFDAGFFILYKNTPQMLELYKLSESKENMAYSYKNAFRTDYACYFDEYMGMSILGTNYCNTFRDQLTETMVQDFSWNSLGFKSYITKEYFVFQWREGKLYKHLCNQYGDDIEEQGTEYLLVHIQKRNMICDFEMCELQTKGEFWIVPNKYVIQKPETALYSKAKAEAYEELIAQKDKERRVRNMKRYGILQYIPHAFRSRKIRKWISTVKGFY